MSQPMKQHRSQGGQSRGETHGTVLLSARGSRRAAPMRPSPILWTEQRALTSELAALGGEMRRQLTALTVSEAMRSLRQVVEGRTLLASLVRAPEPAPVLAAQGTAQRVFTLHPSRKAVVVVERCRDARGGRED